MGGRINRQVLTTPTDQSLEDGQVSGWTAQTRIVDAIDDLNEELASVAAGATGFAVPAGAIDIGDAASAGAAATHSRSDHQHAFPAPGVGYPVDVASAAADGAATTAARSDHGHAHGSGYLPDAHHAQSHTLTSHSTRAHSELTGVGADDHHAQSHTVASHSDATEGVQDIAGPLVAVGGTKTGITITYQDVTNDMDFVVDHDGGTNFVTNEHIDHTAVTLTAGVGLSGGGDISANRTFTVDLNELTTEAAIAAGDFLAMVDITDSGSGKITFANLEATISHDNIAGVSSDDHHAESHTLTSHSTRAHSELTGVGADDHHAQSHTLTSHSTRAHSELTGVGTDDHHAGFIGLEDNAGTAVTPAADDRIQLTDDGVVNADAVGNTVALSIDQAQISHDSIGGVSADDHHAQSHALDSHSAFNLGGNTLVGDTTSGGDATIQSTSHATRGSIFLGSATEFELDETTGQLRLPTTGSGAGLLIGGDALWYRSAADIMRTPDALTVDGLITASGHIQMAASGEIRDSGGTAQITIATASPEVIVENNLRVRDNASVGPSVDADVILKVQRNFASDQTSQQVAVQALVFISGQTTTTTKFIGARFETQYNTASPQTLNQEVIGGYFAGMVRNTGSITGANSGLLGGQFVAQATQDSGVPGTTALAVPGRFQTRWNTTATFTTLTLAQLQLFREAGTLTSTTVRGVHVFATSGTVSSSTTTFTDFIGIDIADLALGSGLNISLRSQHEDMEMRHAGSGVFGANAAPANASVGLEVQSTTKSLMLPRMATTQRNALTALNGMMIYNTTNGVVEAYEGGAWVNI